MRAIRLRLLRIRRALRAAHRSQRGATALEWTLLLAVIALPGYALIRMGLSVLAAHYRLVTTINELPFP